MDYSKVLPNGSIEQHFSKQLAMNMHCQNWTALYRYGHLNDCVSMVADQNITICALNRAYLNANSRCLNEGAC